MSRVINFRRDSIVRARTRVAAALVGALAFTSAHAQTATPNSVKTRIGDLKFELGFPTEETTRKVFDEIDYQRAVQAYLWAYPAVSFESMRIGTKRDLGADLNDLVIADNYFDTKGVFLTAPPSTRTPTLTLGSRGRSSSRSRRERSSD
jgi:hypothetical protein